MRNFFISLLIVCCGLVSPVAASNLNNHYIDQAIELMGSYEGYRDSNAAQQLDELRQQHFRLLHEGKTQQAAKLLKDQIEPMQRRLGNSPKSRFRTYALTATAKGFFSMNFSINPVSRNEERIGRTQVGQFTIGAITLEEFAAAFASPQEINEMQVDKHNPRYDTFVSTKINGKEREVTFRQTYYEGSTLDEDHYLTFFISDSNLTKITLQRNRRRLGRLRNFMNAEVTGISKTEQGLVMDRMGHLVTRQFIEKALQDKSTRNFSQQIRAEKAFLNR